MGAQGQGIPMPRERDQTKEEFLQKKICVRLLISCMVQGTVSCYIFLKKIKTFTELYPFGVGVVGNVVKVELSIKKPLCD